MTEEEQQLIDKLSKPLLSFSKLEAKLVSDWNNKMGTSFKTVKEVLESVEWSDRFDQNDGENSVSFICRSSGDES